MHGGTVSTRDDDVEEFAALLRRLKARTDRSYGALARRVNMNTSTLHRYCAGDAVPLDFAPVERFAALCGATPAERLELHRLWIQAVAARQRPRTPGAQESPEPGPTPDPAPTPAPALAPVTDAAGTGPEGSDGPEQVGGPDETHGPEGSDESESGSSGAAEPEPVSSVPTVSSSSGGSGPRPRRAWYRRRVTVTAAVVTVLLVTLGSLSALSDDRRSDDASRIVGPSEGPTSTATGDPRDRRSTSPSPKVSGPSSSSPSAGGKGKASTPPARTASRRRTPAGRTVPAPPASR